MSILSSIASWFSKQRTSSMRVFSTGTTEVYPDITETTAINRGFNYNTAVYSIIKKDAKKFGTVDREVEWVDEEREEDVTGPLVDLINQPNPYQGQDAFFTLVRAFYKTCGNSFIWLNRGDTDMLVDDNLVPISDEAHAKKPVLEMYVLPANQVIVVPDPENIFGVYGYILESNTRIPFRKVDIIHWKDINLNFDVVSRPQLRGMSPLMPGVKALEANNSATDATVRMNQNGGSKGVLANKTMAQMNPKQESELRAVIDGKINNTDVKGAVSALQGEWSYLNLGLTSIDLDLLKGKAYSMQELCFMFGLPYELFDSQTTFANKEMAQKGWVINEIMPDCKQLDGELNRVLPKAFGLEKVVKICSDFDDMPELQTDKAKQVEWLSKAPLTVNEMREALDYDKIEGEIGETVIIPSGYQNADTLMGDGGEEILNSLYNANGGANRGKGMDQVPKDR